MKQIATLPVNSQQHSFGVSTAYFIKKSSCRRLLMMCFIMCVATGFSSTVKAQLAKGDVAFTSFNADEDGFSIVTFVNIPANTIIYFTDNEALTPASFNTGESYLQWNTGTAVITAGTVIRFSAVDKETGLAASSGTLSRVAVAGSANYGISTSADIIYAFTGASAGAPTTILAAISSGDTVSPGDPITNAGLTVGVNAIVIRTSADYGEYNGARSGRLRFTAYQSLVNNVANWIVDQTDSNYAATVPVTTAFTTSLTIDLSKYVRIGRYDLPEPTRTTAPANSVLAQEVSAVTYNWDTGTLFVVGDGGTSVVQVTKTGQLINSMTLAKGNSPQGTEFYDTEGLTYIGGNKFVMVEERDRRAVLFTYVPNTTLTRDNTKTVTLGTNVGNIGIEGISYDPLTGGFIAVKETSPEGIFQTGIDFDAGTATNGSPSTVNSINLFDPALAHLTDLADVYALSNLPALNGQPFYSNLLLLSQEDGKIVNIDRSGSIANSLTIMKDEGNPLSVADQQHEGLTMDSDGVLYVVSENGGGDINHPQLWVYTPSSDTNKAPTAIMLNNIVDSIAENTGTASPVKVADIVVVDDGLGTNKLTITGPDAAIFEITGNALFIKAGTVLDYETKTSYSIAVNVDDTTAGSTPDASVNYMLTVTDVTNETPAASSVVITEVAPWSSGNSPVGADWFEVTNTGKSAVDITGWKVDDASNAFASAVALNGITSIAPGESVIFLETANPSTTIPLFLNTWFGANPPAGLQVGSYTGSGIGLSTGGDEVHLFNSSGVVQSGITFGTSPAGPYPTFNNAAGLNNSEITTRSMIGVNEAFAAVNDNSEIGSPGTIGKLFISEVAPWSSGNSPVAADWFEVTNSSAMTVDITGWRTDDNSQSFVGAAKLNGVTGIVPGESVIFIETTDLPAKKAIFLSTWFGNNPPANLQFGSYSGSGGLGTGGDQVNLFDSSGSLKATVIFGVSPDTTFSTFDNAAALNNTTITRLSVIGVNGAFAAFSDVKEIGSPGLIASSATLPVTILSLRATQKTTGILLDWSIQTELNIGKYEVERSTDGVHFTYAATVSAKGNRTSLTAYSWLDANPAAGVNYYRVKVLGKNGDVQFTNIVRLQPNTGIQRITVYPNPVKGNSLTLEFNGLKKGIYTLSLYNNYGQRLFSSQINYEGGASAQTIALDTVLTAGIYQLRILNSEQQIITKTLIAE